MRKKEAMNNTKEHKRGGKVIKCTCRLVHPVTHEVILTIEKIEEVLSTYKTIKKFAWIVHDKDTYTAEDEKKDPTHIAGTLKPAHVHIVVLCSCYTPFDTIAKWFGIPSNFFQNTKNEGHNAGSNFLDCVQYLTHEHEKQQALGKYLYPDEYVHANFDFRKELCEHIKEVETYGKKLSIFDKMCLAVVKNGKTLRECKEENELVFATHIAQLKKIRLYYLSEQTPPDYRINIYVSGSGGAGKGLTSKAIAHSLFPDIQNDRELFFEVGGDGVTFEGYDGQPVVIWNDCRAITLLTRLKGREEVFDVFDSHPTSSLRNVKFSSIALLNVVNIVNSVDSSTQFLDGLAGEYTDKNGDKVKAEDKSQAYRRFPIIVDVFENNYFLQHNKGVFEFDKTKNTTLINDGFYKGNLENAIVTCKTEKRYKYNEYAQKYAAPIVKYINNYADIINQPAPDDSVLDDLFGDLGAPDEAANLAFEQSNAPKPAIPEPVSASPTGTHFKLKPWDFLD